MGKKSDEKDKKKAKKAGKKGKKDKKQKKSKLKAAKVHVRERKKPEGKSGHDKKSTEHLAEVPMREVAPEKEPVQKPPKSDHKKGVRVAVRSAVRGEAKSEKAAKAASKAKAVPEKPMTPSAPLAVIVGSAPVTRSDALRRVWAYIKANNLQPPENRRLVRTDDKLAALCGGKAEMTMYEVPKFVSSNLS